MKKISNRTLITVLHNGSTQMIAFNDSTSDPAVGTIAADHARMHRDILVPPYYTGGELNFGAVIPWESIVHIEIHTTIEDAEPVDDAVCDRVEVIVGYDSVCYTAEYNEQEDRFDVTVSFTKDGNTYTATGTTGGEEDTPIEIPAEIASVTVNGRSSDAKAYITDIRDFESEEDTLDGKIAVEGYNGRYGEISAEVCE